VSGSVLTFFANTDSKKVRTDPGLTPTLSLPNTMKHNLKPQVRSGYMLIEALVYIGVSFLLLGIGFAAMYRCIDNSVGLRRSADDITSALHAGERWRADVRATVRPVQLE